MTDFRRPGIRYHEGDGSAPTPSGSEPIKPCGLGKVSVEAYAGKVAEVYGFDPREDSLSELVERLGGAVRYLRLDELVGQDGSIFVHGKATEATAPHFEIILTRFTSPLRDRFTAAHELGHYFLHSLQGERPLIAYRRGSTRNEWEANWFAASLLMPEAEFREAWRKYGNPISVSRVFEVSEAAARVRAERLNCD